MKRCFRLLAVALLPLAGSCGKKSPAGSSGAAEKIGAAAAAAMPVATHLGFATRVPADVDFFFAGYHADETIGGIFDSMAAAGLTHRVEAGSGVELQEERFREAMAYAGDEAFVFVGPGAGVQLQTVGQSYRDLSAAWIGVGAGAMLDVLGKTDAAPDFTELQNGLAEDLLGKWMDAIEKDARLQIPSVVMGWKPHPDKVAECRDALAKGFEAMFAKMAEAKPLSFEASGVAFTGYEVSGREIFGKAVDGIREELNKEPQQPGAKELLEKLTPERIERLLRALEQVHFIMASGTMDGRALIYLGNGVEGFRLAAAPEESLASTAALKWTGAFYDKKINGIAYMSEPVVRAALPWLDTSAYWDSLARAIRPPVREERLIRELLGKIADTERELAARDTSPWAAIVVEDQGWRLETRGGWPDPDLDYAAPLQMADAVLSQNPVFRAHWVQNRVRNDLAWKRMELFGLLADTALGEVQKKEGSPLGMIPPDAVPRMMGELRSLNRAYREEFRAGIGDEVAIMADLKGEMPPFPGISEETVQTAKIPRFVIARPVTDRAKLDAAGKSYAEVWKNLTTWATEQSGSKMPLILPQSMESDDLVTWYPPLPFIGGDFVPGVTLSNKLWMIGTSRSMAGGFSKAMGSPSTGTETGMRIELDFAPLWDWTADIYRRNEADAEKFTTEATEATQGLTRKEDVVRISSAARRLQKLVYRKWLSEGSPRSSLHLQVEPAGK